MDSANLSRLYSVAPAPKVFRLQISVQSRTTILLSDSFSLISISDTIHKIQKYNEISKYKTEISNSTLQAAIFLERHLVRVHISAARRHFVRRNHIVQCKIFKSCIILYKCKPYSTDCTVSLLADNNVAGNS